MKIENEKEHPIYYSFGKNDRYLPDIEPGQLYVQNNTKRNILVHTVANVNGDPHFDFLKLGPSHIGEVSHLPTIFFASNDDPVYVPFFSNKPGGYVNAVSYCE